MSIVENNLTQDALNSQNPSNASAKDYITLMKPRVMSLVVFTAFVGLAIAPGHIHPVLALTAIVCIAIGAGASGVLNMWYDADIDRLMARTALRPVAVGRIERSDALAFGLVLSAFSVMSLGLLINWAAGALLAFTIFFYVVIYTMWLKRSTPQNIVIGGAAGAFPPVIGWMAVTGTVSLEPIILFLMIFLWTPPHFWALALFKRGDYERAGIPMLPCIAGDRATQRQILIYIILLAPCVLAPWFIGFAGPIYGITASLLTAVFFILGLLLHKTTEEKTMKKAAKKLFAFSILYLFILFAVLLIENSLILSQGLSL